MRAARLLTGLIFGCLLVARAPAAAEPEDVLAGLSEESIDDLVARMDRCGGLHRALADAWSDSEDPRPAERAREASRSAESAATFLLAMQALRAGSPGPGSSTRPSRSSNAERSRAEVRELIRSRDAQALRFAVATCSALDPVIEHFAAAMEYQARQSLQR